jgi:ubiquinone/menaquinone biosynthesis C-methylase UbiE
VISRISHAVGGQLQNPSGFVGRAFGTAMTLVNERANRLTISELDIQPGHHVLELGFGPGRAIARMADRVGTGMVAGIDRSQVMMAQARRRNRRAIDAGRVRLMQGGFDNLPFPASSFDRVAAINVAYFWPRNNDIMREIDRVTRFDGRIALYATHRDAMERWFFTRTGSHRLYDETDLETLFTDYGFPVSQVRVVTAPVGFGVQGVCVIGSKAHTAFAD